MDWFLQQHLMFKEGGPCKQHWVWIQATPGSCDFCHWPVVYTFLVTVFYLFNGHSFGWNCMLMCRDCVQHLVQHFSNLISSTLYVAIMDPPHTHIHRFVSLTDFWRFWLVGWLVLASFVTFITLQYWYHIVQGSKCRELILWNSVSVLSSYWFDM